MMRPQDSNLRRLKAEHLKQRGDAAIKEGNYRQAYDRYSEAIQEKPDKAGLHVLYSNRAQALLKAQRYSEALADADEAIRLAPQWHKGHWRRAIALLGLQRVPEAVLTYLAAWRLSKGDAECDARLWQTVQRLTREQLGAAILRLLHELEKSSGMKCAQVESVSEQEMVEAWFRLLQAAHQGKPKPGQYYQRYLGWLKHGLPEAEAYTERSAMYAQARCYLQAAADARAAMAALARQRQAAAESDAVSRDAAWRRALADAYLRLGRACLAEPQHPDRRCREAAKAFLKGADLDPERHELHEGLQEAGEELTKEALEAVAAEVYNEGAMGPGEGLTHPSALGYADAPQPGQRIFRVELRIAFPAAAAASLGARARELLRGALAAAASVEARRAGIERVFPPLPGRPGLAVEVHVQVGADVLCGAELVKAVQGSQESLEAAVGGVQLTELLGAPDARQCSAELVDITPACTASEAERAAAALIEEGADVVPDHDRRLAQPSRPKLELELPYRLYRLVRADGSAPERTDKHPFCMSRVYYDASEKPEEVWVELLDGSCRWRQTGSEVKVMLLKVPQQLSSGQLTVTIEPYFIKVANKSSGEVYLEGELERGVVPEDSFWTHCQGEGEDGCMLYLRKMNLELLQRHWMHSEMWWPRLLRCHGEIAWDDYEKDYSDLPDEVLRRHRVVEAIKDDERKAENMERTQREALQERDDLRKRTRQERLNELRTGCCKDWVTLHRENPPVEIF